MIGTSTIHDLDRNEITPIKGKLHCVCTTSHSAIDYQYDKVAWANTPTEVTCPVCDSYHFLFLEKGGVRHNAKYLISKS